MRRLSLLIIASVLLFPAMAFAQVAPTPPPMPGDRIAITTRNLAEWIPAALTEDYLISPGDSLAIDLQTKANLQLMTATPTADEEKPVDKEIIVTPGGSIFYPLVGEVQAGGKTVGELRELLKTKLAEYYKNFSVSVSVAKVRTVNVWISGEAANPGPQVMPAVCTVSFAALQAGIKPTGSTRRITLIRGDERRTVDLYKMAVTGSVEEDIPLQPGDSVHIPACTDYVNITGEVTRPGQYEMVAMGSEGFCVNDLIKLAQGTLPSAATDRCRIERIGSDGKKVSINLDLGKAGESPLVRGDTLVVQSISAFQPIIRIIGEFKGDGVYQRAPVEIGSHVENMQNKSGIYYLKQGQTVLDVISATGGVTPQADLKRARIERTEGGSSKTIPVDLDRLLVDNDKTADIALENGDSLVLPALADKVHVFGEVKDPSSYTYSPNRRLIDYLGDAGGPTQMAKLTQVSIVRGTGDKPQITRYDAQRAMRGTDGSGNPVLEPGDIVYVPSKMLSGWRDAVQLMFTSLSLYSLFKGI